MKTDDNIYKTIAFPATGMFKDRGSKFFAFAYPVFKEEEIREKLEELKRQYHDARHHCYAYRLGADMKTYRSNDDGEPSNSAGKPILNQIITHGLTNILIVVIRYFGGTLLGTAGLINAYKTATADALNKAKIEKRTIHDIYRIEHSYTATHDVLKILKEERLQQTSPVFETQCSFLVSIRKNATQRVIHKLNTIKTVKTEYLKTQ